MATNDKTNKPKAPNARQSKDFQILGDVLVEKSKSPLSYFVDVSQQPAGFVLSTPYGSITLADICGVEDGAVVLIEKSKRARSAGGPTSSGLSDKDIERLAAAIARKLRKP